MEPSQQSDHLREPDQSHSRPRPSTNIRPPSLLACVQCRRRHVKCNGQMPVCKRCLDSGSECNYQRSRRGYRGPRKTWTSPNAFAASPSDEVASANFGDWGASTVSEIDFGEDGSGSVFEVRGGSERMSGEGDAPATVLSGDYGMSTELTVRNENTAADLMANKFQESSQLGIEAGDDALIDIYYANFNSAHPFLIPRQLYRTKPNFLPAHLRTVMQFVASHFIPSLPQEKLRRAAEAVTSDNIPKDGYKVQSLMLLGMALFSRCEQASALVLFDQAIDLALSLGMSSKDFALNNGMGNPIVEESWRRTWWDLYMIDGILTSLISIQHTFRLQDVLTDVPLPCEDADYAQCNTIPPLHSQNEFLQRAFASEIYDYSSMAYKIEAVRLLGKVTNLSADISASPSSEVETLITSLANFILSLPFSKRHIIERDNTVDEVLFMAHCIIDFALTLLHRPRSTLIFIRNHYPTLCTKEEAISSPVSAYGIHTSAAIKAADSISNATAVRTPLKHHSPCFVCAIAVAAVVHLSAYTLESNASRADSIKERLQLGVNALNSIGEVWPSATAAKGQIAQFGREIFAGRNNPAGHSQAEPQIHQIDLESMMDDQSWLDDLVDLRGEGEGTMLEDTGDVELLPVMEVGSSNNNP